MHGDLIVCLFFIHNNSTLSIHADVTKKTNRLNLVAMRTEPLRSTGSGSYMEYPQGGGVASLNTLSVTRSCKKVKWFCILFLFFRQLIEPI